jgi:hypothetical protein
MAISQSSFPHNLLFHICFCPKRQSCVGPVGGYVSTLMRIQSALEKAGIRFLDNDAGGGIGVRLIKPNA